MVVLALVLLPVAGALFFTTWPHYAGTSVCRTCGIRRDYFDWEARAGHFSIHRFVSDHPTAVSRALASLATVPEHRHDWSDVALPVAAADAPVEAAPNLLYAVEMPRVASFVRQVALCANNAAFEKWKRIVLDPQYSTVIAPSLRFLRFPEGGFADRAAFQAWWQGAEFPLWNRLRELTEPD